MTKLMRLQGEPLKILLVEDNIDHAELVSRSLEEHNVANFMSHVSDGQSALDYLFRQGAYADREPGYPHLILLDLRLPKVDGMEVLRQIKESSDLIAIPVVILTTSEQDIDVAKAYEYHANSYVVKPIDFSKFSELIADLGYYWLSWNHHPWKDKPSVSQGN